MEGEYTVHTEVFKGPLELLLQLVEKRKLFINDIALSNVADDYIRFTHSMDDLPINQTVNFVVVASTLILIKSRSLLPQINLTQEEELSIEELQERLKTYQQIRKLSAYVEKIYGESIIFPRHQKKITNNATIFSPDKSTTVGNLRSAVGDLIDKIPKKEKIPQVAIRTVVSLEDTIDNLIRRVTNNLTISFEDFSGHGTEKCEKITVIVSFLAILELVKQGSLNTHQENTFSDIVIDNQQITIPTYQ